MSRHVIPLFLHLFFFFIFSFFFSSSSTSLSSSSHSFSLSFFYFFVFIFSFFPSFFLPLNFLLFLVSFCFAYQSHAIHFPPLALSYLMTLPHAISSQSSSLLTSPLLGTLYGVAHSTMAIGAGGGIVGCEGVTLLPPGSRWLTLALQCLQVDTRDIDQDFDDDHLLSGRNKS